MYFTWQCYVSGKTIGISCSCVFLVRINGRHASIHLFNGGNITPEQATSDRSPVSTPIPSKAGLDSVEVGSPFSIFCVSVVIVKARKKSCLGDIMDVLH